ncbi:hypothetical protein [Halomonas piscis]|uniref:hypothetical protein n=1 Tax=Halomonas piscis TaxID=3031727 RepID=UPI0028969BD0|nr:hypothetical protein [Halomonas piscis]
MKHRNAARPNNGREKLRQFQELDDAFAKALQELDDPDARPDIPTGPPVRSAQAQAKEEDARARERAFSQRLEALMEEYRMPPAVLTELIGTLLECGVWADKPGAQR